MTTTRCVHGHGRSRLWRRPRIGWGRTGAGSLTDAMAVDRVLLAEPRGFCAGVEMAIKALAWMVRSFEPPVYCYHEIVHNKLIVERFERSGRGVRRRHRRRAAGPADHAVGPRLGARGRRRGPGPRQLRRRLGVPARHQGPPRGQGARRQGLPHRLRRPRGPRGGGRHDGRRPGRDQPGRDRRRGRRAPAFDRAGRAAGPDHAVAPRLGRRRRRRQASASPTCGRRVAATCASPPPTASRR